jgi:hypothetical protein
MQERLLDALPAQLPLEAHLLEDREISALVDEAPLLPFELAPLLLLRLPLLGLDLRAGAHPRLGGSEDRDETERENGS